MTAWLLVFGAYVMLDIVWAWYTRSVSEHQPYQAALWAGVIPLLGGVATIEFVQEPWLLTAAAAGGACGTFLATVRWR